MYVDDIIVASNNMKAMTDCKIALNDKFKIKDLVTLKYFLGLEVARNSKCIFLCQRNYALEILNDLGMIRTKTIGFPMDPNPKLRLMSSC